LGLSGFTQNFTNQPVEITNSGALGQLGETDRVINIEFGAFTGAAITLQNKIIVWGNNTEGQAGGGTTSQFVQPTDMTGRGALAEINFDLGESIVSLTIGFANFHLLTSTGKIISWGRNSGSTGNDLTSNTLVPVRVDNLGEFNQLNPNEKVTKLVKGRDTVINLTSLNNVFGWGDNSNQLFFGSNRESALSSINLNPILNAAFTEPYENVINLINALPDITVLTLEDETQVIAAREAYDALTVEEKALVTNYQDLIEAENKLNDLQKAFDDQIAADAVIALINALPEVNALTLEDEGQVEAARTAYDALTTDQQALVVNYQTLLDAEAALQLIQKGIDDQAAANIVISLIDALPLVNNLTLEDEDQVEAARAAYDALTPDQKALVTNYQELLDAEAKLDLLKQQALDQAAADDVIDLINALPEIEALTKEDEAQVVAARAAFDALTATQQSLVTNLAVLVNAENALAALRDNQGSLLLIVIIFATIISLLSMIYWFLIGKKKQAKPVPAPIMTNPIAPTPIEPTIATIQLDDVKLSNFDTRPKFQPLSKVNPGFYLEITSEKESTNRVVEVQDLLPEGLDETNSFVSISKEEVKQVKLELTSTSQFVKKTPGSFVDPGYYVEVDLQDKIVDNYILAKKRLPPSSAKGHRWIRIEKRKITK
jgi:hypothetical protein